MIIKNAITGLAAAGLLGLSMSVSAAPIPLPQSAQLSDNSAEYLINVNGGNDTTLDMGDRLRGIFTIETVEDIINGGTAAAPFGGNYLTGIFDITVDTKVANGGGGWIYTFSATGGLVSAGDTTAVAMFYDPMDDYSRLTADCATTAICEANASDGSLWAEFGFGATSFWRANVDTDDLSVVALIPAPGNGGTFNLGLDMTTNNTGYTFLDTPCFSGAAVVVVDVCGSGSVLGIGGVNTPFDTFNNVDFVLNRVPEPASLSLLGLGLLSLVGARRRRKVAH